MANKEKAPKKPPQEEARNDPPPASPPADTQKKGNLILVFLIVGAMVVGGIGAFLAMKLFSGPKTGQGETSAEQSQEAHATPPELESRPAAEEPIVAPTKAKSGSPPAASGGHGAPAAEGGAEGGEAAAAEGPTVVKLDPFTTNLNSSGGRAFIKLTMSFEMDNPEGVNQVNSKMDDIRDTIIVLLMGVSADDISTPDGILRLKTQIQSRVNNQLPDYKVRKVNITDIAIQ
ncbi:MAG: flagellar basal body-associated FliL family protein [Deltaproteobacteria bacterium]|jgi:flagellar FliL protein|nr:flagellar basal body-associated FliL family protein [Deltaproteobacteria bacterium]